MVLINSKIDDYDLSVVTIMIGMCSGYCGSPAEESCVHVGGSRKLLRKSASELRSEEWVGSNILERGSGSGGEGECSRQKVPHEQRLGGDKHDVFGNDTFSKVYTMSTLRTLLVNTLSNVCFDTGPCWSLMAPFSSRVNATVSKGDPGQAHIPQAAFLDFLWWK